MSILLVLRILFLSLGFSLAKKKFALYSFENGDS